MAENPPNPAIDPENQDLINNIAKGCLSYEPIPNTPFVPQVGDNYNPKVAAWCMNAVICAYRQFCDPKSKALYPSDIQKPLSLYWHEDAHIFHKQEKTPCGYIAQIKPISGDPTNRFVIALRGTEKIDEWLENIDFNQIDYSFDKINSPVKIHHGFIKALIDFGDYVNISLHEQINNLIPNYINDPGPNELYITGHSLGAAIATLIAADSILHYQNVSADMPKIDKIICYIAAPPRVGSPAFSELLEKLSMNPLYHFVIWRIINSEDVVPTAPAPVLHNLIYTQLALSKPSAPNKIGSVTFSTNLSNVAYNHHILTYIDANNQLD